MSRRVGEECRRDFGPLPVSQPLFHFTIFWPFDSCTILCSYSIPCLFVSSSVHVFFFLVYMFVISTGVHTTARPQAPSTFSPPWLISASSSLVTLVLPYFFNAPVLYFFHLIFTFTLVLACAFPLLFLVELRSLCAHAHWRGREVVTSHF